MEKRTRTVKVWVSLMAAMTVGALALMALDSQPLSAGAFSLATYTSLNPIEEVTLPLPGATTLNWNAVQVYYSQTATGSIEDLAEVNHLNSAEDVNFHFIVHNGTGKDNGLIRSTHKWRTQKPCLPGGNWYGPSGTIRICVIADGITTMPSASQMKRTADLIESLARKFNLSPEQFSYPYNWQL